MFTWFRRLLGPTKRDLRNLSAILLDQGDEIAAELRELKCKLGQRDLIDEENTVESLTRELLVEKLEAELAEAKAGVNELIENNDRLVKLISDPKLLELELEPGGALRIGMEPCLGAKVLAASCADFLGDAENWRCVEIGPILSDQGAIIVTVRRKHGKSPEVTVGEQREEIAGLKDEITGLKLRLCKLADTEASLRRSMNGWRNQSAVSHKRAEDLEQEVARLTVALAKEELAEQVYRNELHEFGKEMGFNGN
jgi:predicted RNase H-like nuclease (RuvC/YqgF family)